MLPQFVSCLLAFRSNCKTYLYNSCTLHISRGETVVAIKREKKLSRGQIKSSYLRSSVHTLCSIYESPTININHHSFTSDMWSCSMNFSKIAKAHDPILNLAPLFCVYNSNWNCNRRLPIIRIISQARPDSTSKERILFIFLFFVNLRSSSSLPYIKHYHML